MFKKVYEDPVDTAQDVVDRKLIPIVDNQYYYDFLAQSDNPLYQQLSNITIISPSSAEHVDWTAYDNLIKFGILGNATHVYLAGALYKEDYTFGRFHFSKEVMEGESPYANWYINKKYHLSNDLAKHILIYQQVCSILTQQ